MIAEWLWEPLQFGFFVRALWGTSLIALLAAAVGTFVVLKGLAFIGDAIAHTAFAGLALAMVLGFNLSLGAAVLALLTAVGVAVLNRVSRLKNDSALAILFTGAFSLGVILLTALPRVSGDLSALLLGSVLAIRPQEVAMIAAAALITFAVIAVLFDRLVMVAFDPVGAEASGVPVFFYQTLMMILIAGAVVVSLRAVGAILVAALLITPAATAALFVRSIWRTILWAALLGLTATWIGLYFSFYWSTPPGAVIVLTATLQFALGLLVSKLRGVLTRRVSMRTRYQERK